MFQCHFQPVTHFTEQRVRFFSLYYSQERDQMIQTILILRRLFFADTTTNWEQRVQKERGFLEIQLKEGTSMSYHLMSGKKVIVQCLFTTHSSYGSSRTSLIDKLNFFIYPSLLLSINWLERFLTWLFHKFWTSHCCSNLPQPLSFFLMAQCPLYIQYFAALHWSFSWRRE